MSKADTQENLNAFDFVGITETFKKSITKLGNLFSWKDAEYNYLNKAESKKPLHEQPTHVIK